MKNYLETEPWKVLFILVGLALILRLYFFIGFGLGDDPIYIGTSNYLLNVGHPSLTVGPNYRYGVHLPIALSFKLFGINELSFVLFPLLTSLGQIIILFLIGKELANTQVGLIAAVLSVLSPFDNAFSSTMTVDIPSTVLMCTSFYLFIKGTKAQGRFKHYVLYFLSIIFIIWAYFIKYPILAMLLAHGFYSLTEIKRWKRHASFYMMLVVAFSGLLCLDYVLTGNFLNYYRTGLKDGTPPQLYANVRDLYPRWMFSYIYGETFLFGFYYHITLILTLAYSRKLIREFPVVLLWLFGLFLLMQFMPIPSANHGAYMVMPRFFRYAYGFLPPAILIMAFCLFHLKEQSKILFGFLATTIIVSSLYYSYKTSHIYTSTYGDRKLAAKAVKELIPRPIYSDYWMLAAFDFFTLYKQSEQARQKLNGKHFQWDIIESKNEKEKYELLNSIKEGYVVTGGSRGADVAISTVFNLGDYPVPDYWQLIMEVPRKLDQYRKEPLRIYLVVAPEPVNVNATKSIKDIYLDAQSDWYDTGFNVMKGETVSFKSRGKWAAGPENIWPDTGPEGHGGHAGEAAFKFLDPQKELPGVPFGTLLGKVGKRVFPIGDRKEVLMPESGRLYLVFNDILAGRSDNRGGLNVTIKEHSIK